MDWLWRLTQWTVKPALYIVAFGTVWAFIQRTLHRVLARQLYRPSGFFGKVIIPEVMNQMNLKLIEAAIEELDTSGMEVKDILEVGCGSGTAFKVLMNKFRDARIQAVDHSSEIIEYCNEKYLKEIQGESITLHLCNILEMPFTDKSFDMVIGLDILHMFSDRNQLMVELKRQVRPGGWIIIGVKNPSYYIREPEIQSGIHLGLYKVPTVLDVVDLLVKYGFKDVHPAKSQINDILSQVEDSQINLILVYARLSQL